MTTDISVQATKTAPAASVEYERRFLEPEIEMASRDQITALQEKRILELVPYVWEHSPFYRELWSGAGVSPDDIRCLGDFTSKVPTFCKDDIKAYRERTGDPFGGLLCVDVSELTSITSTSGTTGMPELIPEIWEVAPPLPTHYARNFWEIGLRPGDKVLMPPGSFRGYFDDFLHMMGLIPIYIDSWVGQGEQVLQAIERHQVAFLQLFLPIVLEFEKLENRYDIKAMLSSLKGAAFAGMPLGKMLTQKVRDQWGVDLYTYTSAGDTGTAWEGREHDGYVLWEDTVLAETLDTVSGAPVGEREIGELIATDLDNWAAPYVRFRSGDIVRMTREPAPCGRTHARMWVLGRSGDEMLVAAKPVMLSEIWQLVESVPELGDGIFQVVRYADAMQRLRVRAGYPPERTGDLEELRRRATGALEAGLGVPVDVELRPIDDLLATSSSVAKFSRVVKA
ncbi:phenylacetate--CoA ligase family protein [uncultured Mycobacterium sp.]|uniref:phenylacetate--CoA ligase family protein n=1 Tax=uncultured Mycobacterium sp. TaxID=171292 RepID=UPI0035CC5DC4